MSEPKQVIVVRKDLNMRKGKIAAQAAHASMKVLVDLMDNTGDSYVLYSFRYPVLEEWLSGRFTKICVSVDSEQELLDLYQKARDANMLCSLIVDAGLTEFNGVPTKTCIAIGPELPEKIDQLTGHLKLL